MDMVGGIRQSELSGRIVVALPLLLAVALMYVWPVLAHVFLPIAGAVASIEMLNLLPLWRRLPVNLQFSLAKLLRLPNAPERRHSPWAYTIWLTIIIGLVVWAWLLSALYIWAAALIVGVIATDTGAYVVGKVCKVLPFYQTHQFSTLSPNKTIEGVVGGIVFGMVAVVLVAGLGMAAVPLLVYPIGISVALVAIYGDLIESIMKRSVNVKDTAGWLLGHGGLIDRLDSIGSVYALIGLALIVMKALGAVLS